MTCVWYVKRAVNPILNGRATIKSCTLYYVFLRSIYIYNNVYSASTYSTMGNPLKMLTRKRRTTKVQKPSYVRNEAAFVEVIKDFCGIIRAGDFARPSDPLNQFSNDIRAFVETYRGSLSKSFVFDIHGGLQVDSVEDTSEYIDVEINNDNYCVMLHHDGHTSLIMREFIDNEDAGLTFTDSDEDVFMRHVGEWCSALRDNLGEPDADPSLFRSIVPSYARVLFNRTRQYMNVLPYNSYYFDIKTGQLLDLSGFVDSIPAHLTIDITQDAFVMFMEYESFIYKYTLHRNSEARPERDNETEEMYEIEA